MPSQVSRILSGYQSALTSSEERFKEMYRRTSRNAADFYREFFHQLVKEYNGTFSNSAELRRIKRSIANFFGSDEIRFAAIDGTCFRESFSEYMVFFGASYGVKGSLSIEGDPPKVRYEKWSSDEDVSFVSYVPIPYAELSDVDDRQFTAYSDEERMNLSSIDTQLMQLAEVYLAYDFVSSSSLRPKLLLIDHSMSSIMVSNSQSPKDARMIGYEHSGRLLSESDIVVAYSHPYNERLVIPYPKIPQMHDSILRELFVNGPQSVEALAEKLSVSPDVVRRKVSHLLCTGPGNTTQRETGLVRSKEDGTLEILPEYDDSWRWIKDLFKSICEKLFKEKNTSALRYYYTDDEGVKKETWMTPADLKLLISVGIRALIEECWRHEIMLVGITKDSSSRYLSRNYLGVMRDLGLYEFENVALPWTDRSFLEVLPFVDESIAAPWATVEFDGCFMTLARRQLSVDAAPFIQGVRGDIIAPQPRLFARSLGQFYIDRSKGHPLTGHVIFIDRLVQPRLDDLNEHHIVIEDGGARIGRLELLGYRDSTVHNDAQDIMMFALHILTRNLYPQVIGYPDPLHKADWGAKSIRNKIVPIVKSSGFDLRIRPLNRTFRDIRSGLGGK